MVYTVTFNPAIDYLVSLDEVKYGMTNRVKTEAVISGGKGINVSIVLTNMGIENTALGFTSGFTGFEILRQLDEMKVKHDFITLGAGFSRINVKIKELNAETEINGNGPDIKNEEIEALLCKIAKIKKDDILVLAGSIPASLPDDIYENIMLRLQNTGAKIVVDATGDLLRNVLKYKPFLIKPNKDELEEFFAVKINSQEEIFKYAKELIKLGAENVIVSMGGDGAICVSSSGEEYYQKVPKGKLINSTGAGDSLVAGFLTGYLETNSIKDAFLRGVATGSASAFSKGLATKDKVEELLNTIKN